MVILEIKVIVIKEKGWMLFIVRSIKNTPAVTKVDEWTKAEIGVGAAIAAGSQAENGNWALFEMAAVISKIKIIFWNSWFIVKFQFIDEVNRAILKRIVMSPILFLKIVIVPEAAAE